MFCISEAFYSPFILLSEPTLEIDCINIFPVRWIDGVSAKVSLCVIAVNSGGFR